MPSDQSTWLIAVPNDGDSEGVLPEISQKLTHQSKSFPRENIAQLNIPSFKTGTLDGLISLSEDLPKQESACTGVVAKIVDTLRSLLSGDATKLAQHTRVNEQSLDSYLLGGWRWNESRYGTQRSLREMVDVLNKEITSIDNTMKSKLNNYNVAKGSLVQMQRKKTGNLSVKSLAEVVSRDDFIQDSEYLETLLIAVPKNLSKDWKAKYERLASMVVPRSSHEIASDEDYVLVNVVIFRRVHDEFSQKCRENKFIVRDFAWTNDILAKQTEDLSVADSTERELWTELLRLARINFSEAFQALVHLKVIRLFVESVLRYGLPANYTGIILKPEAKGSKKALSVLSTQFTYLAPRSNRSTKGKGESHGEVAGEYQQLMEQEFYDFVVFEVPWIVE